jgi:hypothetical protein
MKSSLFAIFIFVFLHLAVCKFLMYDGWKRPIKPPSDGREPYTRDKKFWDWAQRAKKRSVGREELVQSNLRDAAGVYKDKKIGEHLGLEKTVLITVLSYPRKRHHFLHYFRNFLCYAKTYNFDLVVYVTRDRADDYKTHLDHLKQLSNLGVRALPYPEELHYLMIYGKAEHFQTGKKFSTYEDDYPSFLSHGALVMIMPGFEILLSGYNFIYFDVDIALIVDPIPHIILGDADFVASIENKDCLEQQYAADARTTAWDDIEFNTGVMMARSTKQGVDIYTKWLERLIDLNMQNDQQVFTRSFRRYNNMTYASNCLPANTVGVIPSVPSKRSTPDSATYCALSDILFQNGKTALSCTKSFHMLSYTSNMIMGGIPAREVKGTDHAPYSEASAVGKYRDVITGQTTDIDDVYYMATVHVNYSGGKSDELNKRGLWLYHHRENVSESDVFDPQRPFKPHLTHDVSREVHSPTDNSVSCTVYNLSSNHYSTMLNFKKTYAEAKAVSDGELLAVNKPGELIKRATGRDIYLVGNDSVLHAFPNGDTFIKMGYEWGQVKSIMDYVFGRFHVGEAIPDLAAPAPLTEQTKRLIALQADLNGTHHLFVIFGKFESPNINYSDTRWGAKPYRSQQ